MADENSKMQARKSLPFAPLGTKKGFFLTVLALVILAFMLVSISWWATSVSEQESRSSERFRAEAVKAVLLQVSDAELSRFANISSYFALSKMAQYTSNVSTLPRAQYADPSDVANSENPNTGNVNATIYELINYGTSSGHAAGGPFLPSNVTYDGPEMNYTFTSWSQSIASAVEAAGYRLSVSPMRDFRAVQVDPWTVNVRFSIEVNLTDAGGTIRMSRTAHADSNLTLDGLLDPMIYRGDDAMNRPNPIPIAQRQIFHIPQYNVRDDVKPQALADGLEGKGWFYGPITGFYPTQFNASMNTSKIKTYILETTYDGIETEATNTGITVKSIAESYGGVLLVGRPNETRRLENIGGCDVERVSQGKCFDCLVYYTIVNASEPACASITLPTPVPDPATVVNIPFLDVEDSSWLSSVPKEGGEYHLLIESKAKQEQPEYKFSDPKKAYNIEALRDMAVCGFYVQSPDGPSYFQRMVTDSQYIRSTRYGIETFVVGKWAGGALMPTPLEDYDKRSRVDRLFYTSPPVTGNKVRGMMGCKSREMCDGAEALYNATGHFTVDDATRDAYGMKDLMCDSADFADCRVP